MMMKWITVILALALLITHYQIWIHDGGLHKQYVEINEQVTRVQQQNQALQTENKVLKAQVENLQHGFDAISEIARTKMGYIQQGEVYYEMQPQ